MDSTPPLQAQPEGPRPSPPPPQQQSRLGARACPIHAIVLGPFGRCVICERARSDASDDPTGGRKALGVMLVLVAALGGVLVYKGVAGKPEPPVLTADSAWVPPSEAPALEERAAEEEVTVARMKAAAEQTQGAYDAAMRKVSVRVYTTKRCALCATAKDWMKSKNIAFTELDVGADPGSLAVLRKINPASTVPTFVVDRETLVGFGPGALQGAIFRAAEQRVR